MSGSNNLVPIAVTADGQTGPVNRRRSTQLAFFGPLRLRRAGEKEAFLLSLICALDMYSTLWWVLRGEATEANPLLAWTFHYHPIWFVIVKSLSCLPALFFLTTLAQKNRAMTITMLRVGIAAYIAIYLLNVH